MGLEVEWMGEQTEEFMCESMRIKGRNQVMSTDRGRLKPFSEGRQQLRVYQCDVTKIQRQEFVLTACVKF